MFVKFDNKVLKIDRKNSYILFKSHNIFVKFTFYFENNFVRFENNYVKSNTALWIWIHPDPPRSLRQIHLDFLSRLQIHSKKHGFGSDEKTFQFEPWIFPIIAGRRIENGKGGGGPTTLFQQKSLGWSCGH